MTIIELFNKVDEKIKEITNLTQSLNEETKEVLNQRLEEVSKDIKSVILTETDVSDIVRKIIKTNTAKNAGRVYNLTFNELKTKILSNDRIIDFRLIENGATIRYSTDSIDSSAINDGYELFCPHSREEFELARKYLLSINKNGKMGPLGIYYDGNDIPGRWCHGCWHAYQPLNSDGLGKLGWKVKDGSLVWWASDRRDIGEPNGDAVKFAYLGIWYDSKGNVKHYNDAGNKYAYKTYLTVKRKKD